MGARVLLDQGSIAAGNGRLAADRSGARDGGVCISHDVQGRGGYVVKRIGIDRGRD